MSNQSYSDGGLFSDIILVSFINRKDVSCDFSGVDGWAKQKQHFHPGDGCLSPMWNQSLNNAMLVDSGLFPPWSPDFDETDSVSPVH